MSPRRVALVALVTGTVFLTSSCSESSTGNSGDPLTAGEANYLIAILMGLILSSDIDLGEDGVVRSDDIDEEMACLAEGGVATFVGSYTGSYDAETDEGEISVGGTIDFEECALEFSDTVNAVLNGDPGVDVSLEYTETASGGTYAFEFDGGVEFETDDERSGRCDLDLTVELVGDAEGFEPSVSGSACGIDADGLDLLLL